MVLPGCDVSVLGFATGLWGVLGILFVKRRWRHAFFSSIEDTHDLVYVAIALRITKHWENIGSLLGP